MAKQLAHYAAIKPRVPCCRNPRAESPPEHVVGILEAVSDVTHKSIAEAGIVNLASKGRALARCQVIYYIDLTAGGVDKRDLLAVLFNGRGFEQPAQAVIEGKGGLEVPSVAEI